MLGTRSATGLFALAPLASLISALGAKQLAPAADGRASAEASAVHADTLPVPTDPHELRAWLARGIFEAWPHQPGPRSAQDPHGPQAQVFLNPPLDESVHARKPVHHQGAAAVLQMSDADGLPMGWAVAVKVHASSNHGRGWYWYQVKAAPESGRTDFGGHVIPNDPQEAGLGAKSCVTCHVKGRDYIITTSLE